MIIPQKLNYDLKKDTDDYFTNVLTRLGKPVVKGNPIYSLLQYSEKYIDIHPRIVKKSKQLSVPAKYVKGFEKLEKEVVNGGDLNIFQSSRYDKLKEDQMYNEWSIRHFHLGEKIDSKTGKIEGTKDILFVMVSYDAVYFIQIKSHRAFSSKLFLEIIDSNWPELIDRYAINDTRLSYSVGSRDRHKLRKCGVTTFTRLKNGKIFTPINSGYASDGSSVNLIQSENRIIRRLKSIEKLLEKNANQIIKDFEIDESSSLFSINLQLEVETLFDEKVYLIDRRINKEVVINFSKSSK